MDRDKIYELLTAIHELFEYGHPVYPHTNLNDNGETFKQRVEELLGEFKEK